MSKQNGRLEASKGRKEEGACGENLSSSRLSSIHILFRNFNRLESQVFEYYLTSLLHSLYHYFSILTASNLQNTCTIFLFYNSRIFTFPMLFSNVFSLNHTISIPTVWLLSNISAISIYAPRARSILSVERQSSFRRKGGPPHSCIIIIDSLDK